MRFAKYYWDIRISGNQGVGYQDIRLDIKKSGYFEQANSHLSIDYQSTCPPCLLLKAEKGALNFYDWYNLGLS